MCNLFYNYLFPLHFFYSIVLMLISCGRGGKQYDHLIYFNIFRLIISKIYTLNLGRIGTNEVRPGLLVGPFILNSETDEGI